jgi:putative aminopeptidase FrvX
LLYSSKEGEHIAGAGGVVTRAPAVHNKLRKLLDAAKDKKIPVQLNASSTSTDTDAFAYSNGGYHLHLYLYH